MSEPPAPLRPPQRLEPVHGDVAVMHVSFDGDGASRDGWAVVEWGSNEVVDGAAPLSLDDARARARMAAAGRRRRAWDTSDARLLALPRVPVISASAGGTFWISTDVTIQAEGEPVTMWRSHASLSAEQALAVLAENGFTGGLGTELLASARKSRSADGS